MPVLPVLLQREELKEAKEHAYREMLTSMAETEHRGQRQEKAKEAMSIMQHDMDKLGRDAAAGKKREQSLKEKLQQATNDATAQREELTAESQQIQVLQEQLKMAKIQLAVIDTTTAVEDGGVEEDDGSKTYQLSREASKARKEQLRLQRSLAVHLALGITSHAAPRQSLHCSICII